MSETTPPTDAPTEGFAPPIPSAEEFFKRLLDEMNAGWRDPSPVGQFVADFLFSARVLWSAIVLRKALPRVAHALGYTETRDLSAEYYRVDQCWWGHRTNAPHDWTLNVALEHENEPGQYVDELQKLLFVGAPLRVVIGYPGSNETRWRVSDKEALAVSRILTLAADLQRVRPGVSGGTLVLILGHRRRNVPRIWRMWKWDLGDDDLAWDPAAPDEELPLTGEAPEGGEH